MKKCLLYEDVHGECRIIVPSSEFKQSWETTENAVGRLCEMALPEVADVLVCDIEKIPTDLTFRRAWKKGDCKDPVKIDLEIAKTIHRDRLRHSCAVKIEELDVQLEVAIENDNLPEQVALKKTKKILRNLHNCDLSHCKTANDIKYSIPKELHDVWVYYKPVP